MRTIDLIINKIFIFVFGGWISLIGTVIVLNKFSPRLLYLFLKLIGLEDTSYSFMGGIQDDTSILENKYIETLDKLEVMTKEKIKVELELGRAVGEKEGQEIAFRKSIRVDNNNLLIGCGILLIFTGGLLYFFFQEMFHMLSL